MKDDSGPLSDEEIVALFARLREQVYRAPAEGQPPSTAREEAERSWPVTAQRPAPEPSGGWGRARALALRPLRAVLRRAMHWYVEPPLAEQRRFNAAVLELLDELAAREAPDRRESAS